MEKLGYNYMGHTKKVEKDMKENTKKTPNDYPKISFRVDAEIKEEILAFIDRVYDHYVDRRKPNEYAKRKNDIIIEALNIGLEQIEKTILKTKLTRKDEISLSEWQKRNKRNKPKGALF